MELAQRMQQLRKTKGISQEQLAAQLGVSRQAVSKWESAQAVPDLDNILALSVFFGVTTDFLLTGAQPPAPAGLKKNVRLVVCAATALNFMGLVTSAAVWYELQVSMALVWGLGLMALGCVVYGAGLPDAPGAEKQAVQIRFWAVNVWLLAFVPLSFVYNVLFTGLAGPYPLLRSPLPYVGFWAVYIGLCTGTDVLLVKKQRQKRG